MANALWEAAQIVHDCLMTVKAVGLGIGPILLARRRGMQPTQVMALLPPAGRVSAPNTPEMLHSIRNSTRGA
jgi:hypothetical protein